MNLFRTFLPLVLGILCLLETRSVAQSVIVTDIAHLRSLLDPERWVPTNTTQLYEVEGVVSTWVNLTTTDHGLFYLQDATAGIAVFHSRASNSVPPAGARVRVTGPLLHFNGLLEMGPVATNAAHPVTLLSTGQPLPVPRSLTVEQTAGMSAAELDALEGSLVMFTNVTLVDSGSTTFRSGATEKMTDASGYTFDFRIDSRTDLVGQAKPTGVFAAVGVLGQFDTSDPRTSSYQLIPTRFADILTPGKAPSVRFTNVVSQLAQPGELPVNTYSEVALRPGERLEIEARVSDPEGRTFRLAAGELTGLPAGSGWTGLTAGVPNTSEQTVRFVLQPTSAENGRLILPTLTAWNDVATNTVAWKVYMPTLEEQGLVLMEYFANPSSSPTHPAANPLRRDPPSDNPTQHDEYLEWVNFGSTALDLNGWRVWDGTALRHVFYNPTPVASSNAFILYGGPLNGSTPGLDVPSEPASESSAGLALNNNGDTVAIYNAQTNLVLRVVYSADAVSDRGSFTRYPDRFGSFRAQADVSTNSVTPGRQWDGKRFDEAPTIPVADIRVAAGLKPGGAGIRIVWAVQSGLPYSVWAADALDGTWLPLATGLKFESAEGFFEEATASERLGRFYRISQP